MTWDCHLKDFCVFIFYVCMMKIIKMDGDLKAKNNFLKSQLNSRPIPFAELVTKSMRKERFLIRHNICEESKLEFSLFIADVKGTPLDSHCRQLPLSGIRCRHRFGSQHLIGAGNARRTQAAGQFQPSSLTFAHQIPLRS